MPPRAAPPLATKAATEPRASAELTRLDAAERHPPVTAEARRLARFVRWMDDGVRIPGTSLRFGLDAIVGALVPGVGDILTAAASLAIVVVGVRRGLPTTVLARMLVNIAVDAGLGTVPLAGDWFDLVWRANRRNLALLERHQGDVVAHTTAADKVVLSAAVVALGLAVFGPLAALVWLLGRLALHL